MDILIRALPPTVNHMYTRGKGGKTIRTHGANDWTELAIQCIQLENRGFAIPVDTELEFFLVCYYPDLKVKKSSDPLYKNDSDNRLKAAKDAVFEASYCDVRTLIYPDDSQVFDDYSKKRRGHPQTLQLYPAGYCRIILARHGHAREILEKLEQEL